MNVWYWTAIALIVAVGLVHTVLGEKYIIVRLLRRENLPKLFGSDDFTKRTIRFAWHLTTVAWWGLALCIWLLAEGRPSTDVLRVIALTSLVSAIVTLIGSRARHPAWVAFLVVAYALWRV